MLQIRQRISAKSAPGRGGLGSHLDNMAPTLSDVLDELSMKELVKKLEQLGLQTTGTKTTLRERLRKVVEEEISQSTNDQDQGEGKQMANTKAEVRLEEYNEGTAKTEAAQA